MSATCACSNPFLLPHSGLTHQLDSMYGILSLTPRMKITLNDTQDRLQSTHSHARSIEQDLERLEHEMKAKREEFAREKQSLLDVVVGSISYISTGPHVAHVHM